MKIPLHYIFAERLQVIVTGWVPIYTIIIILAHIYSSEVNFRYILLGCPCGRAVWCPLGGGNL